MAENTLQYEWIVTIKGNLDIQFRDAVDVFIAGDLFWYPVEGHPEIRVAPDTLVALGRPKGHRRSYLQWLEGGIAPQVVFEILSPSNRLAAMIEKFQFYDRYGVEEYYVYDPDKVTLEGWLRQQQGLTPIAELHNHVSQRLGIRFDMSGPELRIFGNDGRRFLSFLELGATRDAEHQRAEEERQRAEQERQRAEQECQRAERFAAKLRAAGIDPDA